MRVNNREASPRLSVIVPCFNEESGIAKAIETLVVDLRDVEPYELIVINDGSTDGSAEAIQLAESRYPQLRVFEHTRNRGYGAALKTGIRRATTDIIVITDADGTYPNNRIPELVRIAEESDMVVGARTGEDVSYPIIRRIPKFFLSRYASWMAGQTIPDLNSGLRVMKRNILDRFLNILPDGFSFTTTITLAMLTNHYDIRFVPIGYARRVGRSKIRPIRDTLNFVQLILRTGVYFAPLRVFSPLCAGLILAFLASLCYDVFILNDLTEKTLILLLFAMNTGLFALLADMIDKRSGS
jgi:glycosyltransferase involved in cell wall biosynthesis